MTRPVFTTILDIHDYLVTITPETSEVDFKNKIENHIIQKKNYADSIGVELNLLLLAAVEILIGIEVPFGLDKIRTLLSDLNITKYKFVLHSSASETISKSNDVHFLDYGLHVTYRVLIQNNTEVNPSWNEHANKALFLIGKPNKINRAPLLRKFYDIGKLDKIEYSMVVLDPIKKSMWDAGLFLGYSEDQYESFINNTARPSSDIDASVNDSGVHVYSGFPTDVNLYKNTLLSIISETSFDDKKYITEKTWRAIANKHPFVFAGDTSSLAKLKSMGYKTFEEYLVVKNYDELDDKTERSVAIFDNTLYFMDNYKNHIENIRADVEHNYNLFLKQGKEVVDNLNKFILENDQSTYFNSDNLLANFCWYPAHMTHDSKVKFHENILYFNNMNNQHSNNKTVAMIGVGKLGQDCAEVMAQYYNVVGYDVEHRNPSFTMMPTLGEAVKDRDIIFIAVPTPHEAVYGGETPTSNLPKKDFDYSIVINVLNEVNQHVNKNQLVVLISTVLPGTTRNILANCIPNARFIYNPYLIAMGTTKHDMVNPEMIIIGTQDGSTTGDAKELIEFYSPIMLNNPRIEIGTWDEAEAIKIFYNTFISAKLALVNMIQDVAETNGNMNVDVVTNALANSTKRIVSSAYMKAGLGDAGPCHPRDNIALRYLADRLDLGYDLFKSITVSREVQAERLALRCLKNGKHITIIGKSYKPGVPYTHGSASILVGHYIEKHGGYVNYYDQHTGDIDLKEDWTDVYLIGYWDEYTKHLRCFTNEQQSVVIDPWRQFKDHYKDCSEVIYYGDTRPTTTYTVSDYSISNISTRFYQMFPELKQYEHGIHMIDANVTPDTTFLRRSTEEIVQDIRQAHAQGKSKFIFNAMYEGLMPSVINKIHRIARIVSDIIPAHELFCFSGAIDASEVYDRLYNKIQNKITIVGTNYYLHSTQLDTEPFEFIGEYVKMHKENVFLCFNRMNRDHRVKLLDRMVEYGHYNRGFYSFESEGDHGWLDNRPELQSVYPNINRIKDKLPLKINIRDNRTQYSNTIHEDLYFFQHSLFSIINETLFYDVNHEHTFHKPMGTGSMCISEKTYRCFALQHPFILLARPGTLAELRRQGFKTFSPWIDESYDLIENDEERFNAVFKEICRLMAHNHNGDWDDIQKQWKHVIEYNKLHFHTTKRYTNDMNILRHFNDVNVPVVIEQPKIIELDVDEVITMPITGDGDKSMLSTVLTSGLKFEYPVLLDGGGLEMKDDLVDIIKRTGKEHYTRAFEWCAGYGALGFEVLGSQLTDHIVFSDYFHVALDHCKKVAEDNNLSHQITCHLSSRIKDIPSVEKWDLIISNPPHSEDRDSLVEYMTMRNDENIDNTARLIIDQNWTIHKEFFRNIKSHLTNDADLYIIESQQHQFFIDWAIAGGLKHVDTYYINALPRGGVYHFKVNV